MDEGEGAAKSLIEVVEAALANRWVVSLCDPASWEPLRQEDGSFLLLRDAETAAAVCAEHPSCLPCHILGTDPAFSVCCLYVESSLALATLLDGRELPPTPRLRSGEAMYSCFLSETSIDDIREVAPGAYLMGQRGIIPVPGSLLGGTRASWEDGVPYSHLPTWLADLGSHAPAVPTEALLNHSEVPPLPKFSIAGVSPINQADLSDIDLSQVGMGDYFASRYGDHLRFVPETQRWLCWGEHSWTEEGEKPYRLLERIRLDVKAMEDAAKHITEKELREGTLKALAGYKHVAPLESLARLLEQYTVLHIRREALDANDFMLGCPNGVVDLATSTFRPGKPEDLITRQTRAEWDESAKCPSWVDFLHRSLDGNEEKIAFLQRLTGYSLTGDTKEKLFVIMQGPTNAGKGLFCTTVCHALGDYATFAQKSTIMNAKKRGGGGEPSEDRVRLRGMRFVTLSESDRHDELDEGFVKQSTGGLDDLILRGLFEKFIKVPPTWKYFLQTNVVPAMSTEDDALWGRVMLVRFPRSFSGGERDLSLPSRLRAELPGILQWAFQGFLDWKVQGIAVPAVVRADLQTLREKQKSPLDRWFAERLVANVASSLTVSELLDDCQRWHAAAGLPAPTSNALGRFLSEKLPEARGRGDTRFYRGIAFAPSPEPVSSENDSE